MSLRIGVCDSGIGGLSVLKELYRSLPADYIYLGDSLRAPYGNKSHDELMSHTKDLLIFLKKQNVDFYVSACNSISTLDKKQLLEELGIGKDSYFDMKDFAECAKKSIPHNATLLIYGTVATIQTEVYQKVFSLWNTFSFSSKHLAFAVESEDKKIIIEEIQELLTVAQEKKVTHIFLACTHYPLIQKIFDTYFSETLITFINPAEYIPETLLSQKGEVYSVSIFTTKIGETIQKYAQPFLGDDEVLLVSL